MGVSSFPTICKNFLRGNSTSSDLRKLLPVEDSRCTVLCTSSGCWTSEWINRFTEKRMPCGNGWCFARSQILIFLMLCNTSVNYKCKNLSTFWSHHFVTILKSLGVYFFSNPCVCVVCVCVPYIPAYFNDVVVGGVCCRFEQEGEKRRVYIMTLGCLAAYRRYGVGEGHECNWETVTRC